MTRITETMLADQRFSPAEVAAFVRVFPGGLEPNAENLLRLVSVCGIRPVRIAAAFLPSTVFSRFIGELHQLESLEADRRGIELDIIDAIAWAFGCGPRPRFDLYKANRPDTGSPGSGVGAAALSLADARPGSSQAHHHTRERPDA